IVSAPTSPPLVLAIRNTTVGCVSIAVEPPADMQGDLVGYHLLLQRLNDNEPRREFLPANVSSPYTVCRLHARTSYALSVEADNGFGKSPPARKVFFTDETVPSGAPAHIDVKPAVGAPSITVSWRKPSNATGHITRYHLYHKVHGHAKWKVDHLSVTRPEQTSYKFELNGLEPSTKYHFRLSASSTKGEGQRSVEHVVMTDVPVPAAPEISSLTFDCKNGILLQWNSNEGQSCEVEITNETSTLRFNTSASKLDVIDLALHDEYKVRVMCMVRSIVDSRVTLKGPWGNEQRFVLSHQCSYQSSVCSPNSKCMRLRDSTSPPRFSLLVAISALVLFVVLCFLIIYSLKGRCLDIKMLIKKKEKCVYLEELSPLVYGLLDNVSDSTTCDDIPVELFYGYCEDLARNDNAKYTSQFQIAPSHSCAQLKV
ncbi:fibronectin type III domain protein, partial [Ostertagia ostertagi]